MHAATCGTSPASFPISPATPCILTRSIGSARSTSRASAHRRRRAPRAVCRRRRQVHLHRPQLLRPCGRVGNGGARRADSLHEGDVGDLRAERRHSDSARIAEDRLGSRARRRHRQDSAVCVRSRRALARRRLLRHQRSLGARVPARGYGAVGQRQERRHVRPDRSVARDDRRSSGSAESRSMARSRRPHVSTQHDAPHDLRRSRGSSATSAAS